MMVDLTRAELGDLLDAATDYRDALERDGFRPHFDPHMFEHLDTAIAKLEAACQDNK